MVIFRLNSTARLSLVNSFKDEYTSIIKQGSLEMQKKYFGFTDLPIVHK